MDKSKDINTFLSKYSKQVIDVTLKARALIIQNLPEVIEEIDIPAKMIVYCYGKKYTQMICTLIPSQKGLKLGFYKGTDLPDPENLLKGSGKISRYVEIRGEEIRKAKALTVLLGDAFAAYKIRHNK